MKKSLVVIALLVVVSALALGVVSCSKPATGLVSPTVSSAVEKPAAEAFAPNPYVHPYVLDVTNSTPYREEIWLGTTGTHAFVAAGQTQRISNIHSSGPLYARYLAYTAVSGTLVYYHNTPAGSLGRATLVRISPGITRIVQ